MKTSVSIAILASALASPASAADPQTFGVWRSDDLGIRFTYSSLWGTSTPTETATLQVINWLGKNKEGLVATCYLQAAPSPLGRIPKAQIHERAQEFAQAIIGDTRKRDPAATLRKVEARMQDNYPVVYLEQTMTSTNIQSTSTMDMYVIVTAWKGRAILFACASTVPNRWEDLRPKVEAEIFKVMRTISFTR